MTKHPDTRSRSGDRYSRYSDERLAELVDADDFFAEEELARRQAKREAKAIFEQGEAMFNALRIKAGNADRTAPGDK